MVFCPRASAIVRSSAPHSLQDYCDGVAEPIQSEAWSYPTLVLKPRTKGSPGGANPALVQGRPK